MKSTTRILLMMLAGGLAILAACATKPRSLPHNSSFQSSRAELEDDPLRYTSRWLDQPEMWPREMSMAARREMLMVNWAMQKAVQEGKIKVRVVSPPLQLTGDISLDSAATHEIVLIADDLPKNKTFLDEYEVRVAPTPSLVVLGAATTAPNLKDTDQILAEQELARLKLDSATVTSGNAGLTNFFKALTNRFEIASTNGQARIATVREGIKELETQISEKSGALSTLTNTIVSHRSNETAQAAIVLAKTNEWQAAQTELNSFAKELADARKVWDTAMTNNTTDSDAAKAAKTVIDRLGPRETELKGTRTAAAAAHDEAKAAQQSASTALAQAEKDRRTKDAELNKLLAEKQDKQAEVERIGAELSRLRTKVEQAQIAQMENEGFIAALSELKNFWTNWAVGRDYFTGYSTNGKAVTNASAISIKLRAKALMGLPWVTVDVIKKDALLSAGPGLPGFETLPSPSAIASTRLAKTLDTTEATLGRLSSLLLADPRQLKTESRIRHIRAVASQLEVLTAELQLFSERPDLAFPAHSQQPSPPNLSERTLALKGAQTNLTNLNQLVNKENMAEGAGRQNAMAQLTAVRKELAKLKILQGSLRKSDDGGGRFEERETGGEMVRRIRQGDQAVFRLNVLRGVVTTTAHLLADDGAAQMFGHAFADQFHAAQVTFRNPNDKPILIYGNTMKLVVRMNVPLPGLLSDEGEPLRSRWWATYEPLDYDSIRRMIEGQQEHGWRRNTELVLDAVMAAGGGWLAVGGGGRDYSRAFGALSALAPNIRNTLEKDLKRYVSNFRDRGLNSIEEIPANGVLTRYVFLPKGPIYGTYGYDEAEANDLPLSSHEKRWVPFAKDARDFGKLALQPAYIHDVRREEVYVEGKRIIVSDPLSANGTR